MVHRWSISTIRVPGKWYLDSNRTRKLTAIRRLPGNQPPGWRLETMGVPVVLPSSSRNTERVSQATGSTEYHIVGVPVLVPAAPNITWAGDITYLPTRKGWLYLAIVVDLYARRIVGWSFSATPDTALALGALKQAVQARKPASGLLFHSDQGCQYTSIAFVERLKQLGITQSMSRRGNCWDNAVVERIFRTLKHEWMQSTPYHDHAQAQADLLPFLSSWYNHRRLHSAIGMRPPAIVDAMAA